MNANQLANPISVLRDLSRHLDNLRDRSPLMGVFNERRHRADLNGVRVVRGILKQSVIRVEELFREKEEKFTRRPSVVEPENRMENWVVRRRHDHGE